MKAKSIILFLLSMLLGMTGSKAQNANRLIIPDLTALAGSTVSLPINMDNTNEVVAVEFDFQMPEGSKLEPSTAKLTNRATDHTVTFRAMGNNTYHCLIFSPTNSSLLGRTGQLMSVSMNVSEAYEEGSQHTFLLSDAVIALRDGSNGLTDVQIGTLTMQKGPDLFVHDVSADAETYAPGGIAVISWQVSNIGAVSTEAGWTEYLSIKNDAGVSTLLSTTYYEDNLAAGSVVSRSVEVHLPAILGMDGDAQYVVEVQPHSGTGESQGLRLNNIASLETNFTKLLTLTLPTGTIDETYSRPIKCTLTRSGNRLIAETFTITTTEDGRVSVPSNVTIPAGQSAANFYIQLADNSLLDDNSVVGINISGNDYPEVNGQIEIEDNEYPDLQITTSKDNVSEGETFQLTITTSRVSTQPIEVTLTSENTKRFSFPQTVTIAAGETSATVEVTAIDDELPSLEFSNMFTVSAPKHNKAEVIILLKDNDLPVLELQLTPTTVQESASVVAIAGILRRTSNTNSKITVKLTDDSDGGLYFGNRTLVLDKGVEEVHFNFGPVDNSIVDGDRTYTITAAVWLSSCNCGASGESAGTVSAQLVVLDNDGPALQLTSSLSTLKEGGKTTLTVGRNTTDTSKALTVNINSDYDEGLTYEHTVTIPAGQQSVTVEVTSAANSVQGDSHTVIFTVEAEGYAKGTCYLMVTDQTLPDARISSINSSVEEAEVGTRVKLTIEVINDGAAELPAEVAVKVYRRGDATAVGTVLTSEPIAAGGSQTITKTITLPTTVGSHSYYAVVNQENKVQELTYNNNTSGDVTITTISPFAITVATDKTIYHQGDNVIITGQLTGNSIAETDIDIYLINEGTKQVQTVKTDANGTFTYEWQLYALQSGHFSLGACYPGEELYTEMAAFDVYGLKRTTNDFITCETYVGEPFEGTIQIENPGVLPQTITSFEVISKPESCEVVLDAPSNIDANGSALLKYKLTGSAVTKTKDWETITAKLTTKEGSSLILSLYYYCASHYAVLTTNTNSIKTTMTKGTTRDYLLNVMNTGKGATGKIKVLLPDVEWMDLNIPAEMPSLEYGETATVSLRLTPTDDMPLNLPYTGRITLNCENGNGVSVNYNIEVVSEATGILTVDVVDEYTYYTDEKPHVAGAGVVVKHPVTGAIVAQGLTGDDGIYSVELPEGYYSISVTEGHHNSTTGNILIDPGITNHQEVFLSYNAVTYSWDVVETEIEDEYKIETIAKYETNVPKPVVVVNLPTERPVDGSIIAILVTNKGLINAQNVVMNLDCTDGYELELLNPDPVEILAPQQMYTFYARFKKTSVVHSKRRAWGNPDVDCLSIFAGALYDYMCGNSENMEEALAQNGWGDCIGDGGGGTTPPGRIRPIPHTGPNWPGRPSGPNRGGWTDPGPSSDGPGVFEQLRQWYCSQPCGKELTQALACEAADRIIPDWLNCAYNLANEGLHGDWEGRIGALLDCAGLPNPYDDGCWDEYTQCMLNHYGVHFSPAIGANRRAASHNRGYETALNYNKSNELLKKEAQAYRRIADELFGDTEWLECDKHELSAILIYVDMKDKDNDYVSSNELVSYKPQTITDAQLEAFVERINNTNQYESLGYAGIANYINPDTIAFYSNVIDQCEEEAKSGGWENIGKMYSAAYTDLQDYLSDSSSSVCASVSIKISQTMVMTRQAFRGTLTVFNGNEETAMQDVKLNLEIVNKTTGELATSHEFQINAESLDGFSGQLNLVSGWTLDANTTGTATVLFIPTKYAAPEEPVEWSFGGTLSYIDPFTGLEVTRDLYPVTLTVKPSPELDLTYFMQRDVYGDDALTLDVVEPMKPAEFALLINNKGYGDATNVKMVTQQPEIIENEKGLFIDFELISSQVNGGDAALSFGQSIANDFGTIPSHSQMYAQWWLTSTLLGHFVDYNVEATHVTSYGNEDLSLLDQVTIHELIHGFDMPEGSLVGGPEIGRAFLVNDIADANDLPDMLYFTNGDIANVAQSVTASIVRKSDTECELTITPSAVGWNYGSVLDPTHGYAELKSIVRKSDGMELGNSRFWQTDRTLRDGKDWLYENRLHFVDDFASGGVQTYVLTFEPTPETVLEVSSIDGIPAENELAEEPVDVVTVNFSKVIDPETFTADDITMNVQAEKQDASLIGISTEDNKSFRLDLSAINEQSPNGYYTLSVQAAGITDTEGFNGKTGKQVGWIMFRGGLVQLLTSVYPLESGSIQRIYDSEVKVRRAPAADSDNSAKYGSTVTLTATPVEGYEFTNWTLNGEIVSNEPTYSAQAISDLDIVANFKKKNYLTSINSGEGGSISGSGTGYYEFQTELTLTAEPDEGYKFDGWEVDGQVVSTNAKYTFTVSRATEVKALFSELYILGDVNGDDNVNLTDAAWIVRTFVGRKPAGFVDKAADVNGDGQVNLSDARKVVGIFVGKEKKNKNTKYIRK